MSLGRIIRGAAARGALWTVASAIVGGVLALAMPASAAVELIGAQSATFEWTPSTGPVAGYVVVVTRNGDPRPEYHWADGTNRVTIPGEYGDEVELFVIAYAGDRKRFGPPSLFSERIRFLEPPPPPPPPPAGFHDFDGDGDADLVLRCEVCPDVELWELEDGELVDATHPAPVPGEGWVIGGTADYDGSGSADILWYERDTGRIAVELLEDFEPIGWILTANPDLETRALIATGDVDGDAVPEIVMRNVEDGRVEIWAVESNDVVQRSSIGGYSLRTWKISGVGDFDGDGMADLLWMRGYPRQLEIWLMEDGVTLLEKRRLGSEVPFSHAVAGVGDYDGDGRQDVLWRNGKNGQLIVWFVDPQDHDELRLPIASGDKDSIVVTSFDLGGDGADEIVLEHRTSGEVVSVSPLDEDLSERRPLAVPGPDWDVANAAGKRPAAVD